MGRNFGKADSILLANSGFEQANKYVILDAQGHHIGYIAEQESGMMKMMGRQWFGTHRPFVTHVLDKDQTEVLRVSYPLCAALCPDEKNS